MFKANQYESMIMLPLIASIAMEKGVFVASSFGSVGAKFSYCRR